MIFLEITTTTEAGITILAIEGRLDSVTADSLENEINSQIESGNRKILLNFYGVFYISSGGVRVLLASAKELRTDGDRFGLCCVTGDVYKVLNLAGFTSLFSIYPDEGEALAEWQ